MPVFFTTSGPCPAVRIRCLSAVQRRRPSEPAPPLYLPAAAVRSGRVSAGVTDAGPTIVPSRRHIDRAAPLPSRAAAPPVYASRRCRVRHAAAVIWAETGPGAGLCPQPAAAHERSGTAATVCLGCPRRTLMTPSPALGLVRTSALFM